MRRFVLLIGLLGTCALPLGASAHALPVSSEPATSAIVLQAPASVSIRFSERVDESASAISVQGPSGKVVSKGAAHLDGGDPHALTVAVSDDGIGTYVVSWSTVSADDGHFTKGGYAFGVGKNSAIAPAIQGVEVVEIATAPEAVGMTVELAGNGLIWAVLILIAFGIAGLASGGSSSGGPALARAWLARFMALGILLALVGEAAQIFVKAGDLADARLVSFAEALPLYLGTAAGLATVGRGAAAIAVGCIFFFSRRRIFAGKRFTMPVVGMMALMCVFAYLRAKISHATANPFHPEFSVGVNFFHLIETDIWAGLLAILVALMLIPETRRFFGVIFTLVSRILALDFALLSVTGSYIVWLHLKSFDNLFTTGWGTAFLKLCAAATLLFALRAWHSLAPRAAPKFFSLILPATIAAELAFSVLLIYFSSALIITSPPPLIPETAVFAAHDEGLTITLERDRYEDGMLMLTAAGTHEVGMPAVNESAEAGEAVGIDLTKRFDGGYVFPESLLVGSTTVLAVTVPQNGSYDAHATFTVHRGDFDPKPGWQAQRPFNGFTLAMILLALAGAACALSLYAVSFLGVAREFSEVVAAAFVAGVGFSAAVFLCLGITVGADRAGFTNPFMVACQTDANMWHAMEPMRAGVAVASGIREGCMGVMGGYFIADPREYAFDRTPASAEVSLSNLPDHLTAGTPAEFTVSLKNEDGTPAELFVEHEKLLHVIIIGKDMREFAHIHPDDLHPLTSEEVRTSTFTLRYTFPKAGNYLIAVDYSHRFQHESKEFTVEVAGSPVESDAQVTYPWDGTFGGHHVELSSPALFAGQVSTLRFAVTKEGKPVDLEPYLSAAMHIAVVKNDLSVFIHTHGEIHPPGAPLMPIIVKNGQVMHGGMMMAVPDKFQSPVETHLIFPSPGLYTIFAEFKADGKVVPASFSVRIE